jgi:hypothetical protein
LSPGFASISYSVGNTCGNALVSLAFTVNDCYAAVGNLAPAVTWLQVSPNPNTGAFTINLTSTINEEAVVTITNVLAEKVGGFSITTNKPAEQYLQLPTGIYFVTATTPNNRFVQKMVVAN